jgi:protein import protein ZIM17
MASASTSARTLLSRSFAAARQALVQRNPTPRPLVRASAPRVVRAQPRSTAASTRWYSSSSSSSPDSSAPSTPGSSHALGAPEKEVEGGSTGKQPIGRVEPRLSLTFTCQAGPEKENPVCGHRSTHEFSRKSYEKGVVLIQCPECKARHLIADHLGWFNVSAGG